MIGVTLREPQRIFYLYVGDKRVGKVECRGRDTHPCCAYATDCQSNDEYSYLRWCRTLKDAARAILAYHNYGKPEGVALERLTGIK